MNLSGSVLGGLALLKLALFILSLPLLRAQTFTYLIYFFNWLTFLFKPYKNNNFSLSSNSSKCKKVTRV